MNFDYMAKEKKCAKCGAIIPFREYTLYGPDTWCISCITTFMETRAMLAVQEGYWEEMTKRAKIPPMFMSIQPSLLVDKATNCVNTALSQHKPLCLRGQAGSGKSLTLAILAHQLIRRGVLVTFVHCGRLADLLRNHNNLLEPQHQLLTTTGHLILDDIGSEFDRTGFWTGWIGPIIESRFANMRPTSSSANSEDKLDPRIARRLSEAALIVRT